MMSANLFTILSCNLGDKQIFPLNWWTLWTVLQRGYIYIYIYCTFSF